MYYLKNRVRTVVERAQDAKLNLPAARSAGFLQWLDRLSRWLLAAVFFGASVPKIAAPVSFAETIGAYGLLPEFLLLPAALVMSVGEFVTAVGLLFARRSALAATFVFLVLFIGVLSYGISLGLDIDCGCFGPEDPEQEAFAGLRTALIRDILLLIPLFFSTWYYFIKKTYYRRNP